MIVSVVGCCEVYAMQEGEKPKSPGMAYQHYAPHCKTAYFTEKELRAAKELYNKEKEAEGNPCFLIKTELQDLVDGEKLLLGSTDVEMASRLYSLLRSGEKKYSLLIGVEPEERGGAMTGVLNRMRRAFGSEG